MGGVPVEHSYMKGMEAMKRTTARARLIYSSPTLAWTALVAVGWMLGLGGCKTGPTLTPPEVLISPYSAESSPLWAVAPLRNESGTTTVDSLRVTDAIVAKVAEIKGISCLPLNRTIAAMRSLGMPSVESPADANRLMAALGADAIIVGTITAYDPYEPPKLGLSLALFGRGGSIGRTTTVDPTTLRTAGSEAGSAGRAFSVQPLSVTSQYLDALNHEVQMNIKRYAQGRQDQQSARGWQTYLTRMDLYTEFASWWTVYSLLQSERLRLGRDVINGQGIPTGTGKSSGTQQPGSTGR